MPPPMPPIPLPPFPPMPVPALPSFQQTKAEAKAILLAGADAPLPSAVRRHQERVLTRLRDALTNTGKGHRLYVLEVAGPISRVKIGRSNGPRGRIRRHITLMNGFQYGLIDAHVTDPVDDLLAITRAENQAHTGVGKRYKRITGEEFRDADFAFAGAWADIAVFLHQPQEDTE